MEGHLLPCPFKLLTGCDCPACGTQRSVLQLLKGDVAGSLAHNPSGIGSVILLSVFLISRHFGEISRRRFRLTAVSMLVSAMLFQWCLKWIEGACCN
jgi:hypothetical protein